MKTASSGSRAAVLGHPVEHSLSPVLHRAAYEALGLNWSYDAIDVTAESLGDFVDALDETWAGLSLTMPLKVGVLDHLDFVEPMGKMLRAVNTVIVDNTGPYRALVGANTDVHGIVAAFGEAGVDKVAKPVVLGGGATATSAVAAFAQLGSRQQTVVVRAKRRAGGLIRAANAMGVDVNFVGFDQAPAVLTTADAVVSTVPAAVGEDVGAEIKQVGAGAALLDAVYDPLHTPLLRAWGRAGGTEIAGTRMLLHQAAEQVRLMTGSVAPLAKMDHALVSHLSH